MSTDHRPLISVIIPAFNAAKFLPYALASIAEQDYQPLEVIVVDDGSTDETQQVLAACPELVRVHQSNQGAAAARNAGIRISRGELIAFLDADDVWLPRHLQSLLAPLLVDSSLEFCRGNSRVVELEGGALDGRQTVLQESSVLFLIGATLFRRSAFDTVGMFDETLRTAEDFDWYARYQHSGVAAKHITENVLEYRKHGNSLTDRVPIVSPNLFRALRKSVSRHRSDGVSPAKEATAPASRSNNDV